MATEIGATSRISAEEMARLTVVFEEQRSRLRAMLQWRIAPALSGRLDADDLLQETFLWAQNRWPKFAASGMSAYAWLYRIARDCLIIAWRRETREGRDPHREMPWPEQSAIQFGLSLVGTGTSPSAALAIDELRQKIRRILGELKPSDREILWMRDVEETPFREIAAILEITENTAMKCYSRAIRRFQARWLECESSA